MSYRPNHILTAKLPARAELPDNSLGERIVRQGEMWSGEVPIVKGVGTHAINVFKVTGTILVISQIAIITDITNLTNCTNVYASLYDGTLSKNLTADGAVLTAANVGDTFFKDKDETQIYTLLSAATCETYEPSNFKEGKPFYVLQKSGVDTFIRFHLATTSGVDFKMWLEFEYVTINGSKLELA